MMRRKNVIFSVLCLSVCLCVVAEEAPVYVQACAAVPMKMYLSVSGAASDESGCDQCIKDLSRCLGHDNKFAVTVAYNPVPKRKSDFKKFLRARFEEGHDCVLFITYDGAKKPIEWRLYSVFSDDMVRGKRYSVPDRARADVAYTIASQIIYELLTQEFPFLSKIAYRKKEKRGRKSVYSLCVTDFDGSNAAVLMGPTEKIFVAPVWSMDAEMPAVFYSLFLPASVRLMACDMRGSSCSVLNLDGTTVGISFAPWSDEVVYCRSGSLWRYSYDAEHRRGVHRLVVKENSPAACPLLLNERGDLLYCCKGKIKKFDAQTGKRSVVTPNGYCVGPTYCSHAQKVIYSKRINGFMQLFLYDIIKQTHEQLTFESSVKRSDDYRSNKIDASWGPYGVYCAFCWERNGVSRIAVLNTLTKEYHFITPATEHCSYPAWSPAYEALPCVGRNYAQKEECSRKIS